MGTIGPTEWMIIFLIIVLIFGGSKIPGLAKGLGQGLREFKKAVRGDDEEVQHKEVPGDKK